MHELQDLNLSSIPISINVSNPPLLNTFSTIKQAENSAELEAPDNFDPSRKNRKMKQIPERMSENESFEFTQLEREIRCNNFERSWENREVGRFRRELHPGGLQKEPKNDSFDVEYSQTGTQEVALANCRNLSDVGLTKNSEQAKKSDQEKPKKSKNRQLEQAAKSSRLDPGFSPKRQQRLLNYSKSKSSVSIKKQDRKLGRSAADLLGQIIKKYQVESEKMRPNSIRKVLLQRNSKGNSSVANLGSDERSPKLRVHCSVDRIYEPNHRRKEAIRKRVGIFSTDGAEHTANQPVEANSEEDYILVKSGAKQIFSNAQVQRKLFQSDSSSRPAFIAKPKLKRKKGRSKSLISVHKSQLNISKNNNLMFEDQSIPKKSKPLELAKRSSKTNSKAKNQQEIVNTQETNRSSEHYLAPTSYRTNQKLNLAARNTALASIAKSTKTKSKENLVSNRQLDLANTLRANKFRQLNPSHPTKIKNKIENNVSRSQYLISERQLNQLSQITEQINSSLQKIDLLQLEKQKKNQKTKTDSVLTGQASAEMKPKKQRLQTSVQEIKNLVHQLSQVNP